MLNTWSSDEYANTNIRVFKQNGISINSCIENKPSKIYLDIENLPPNQQHEWIIRTIHVGPGTVPEQNLLHRNMSSSVSGEWIGSAGLSPLGIASAFSGTTIYVELLIRGQNGSYSTTFQLC